MVTSAPEGATAPPTTPAETSVPAGRAVLRQNRFKPAEVEAQRGAVTFVNSDDHRHEIVIEGSERPIAVEPGAAATVPAPRKAGTYRLVCRIHEEEGMVGHLVVRRQ